jgi:hypothetical protein
MPESLQSAMKRNIFKTDDNGINRDSHFNWKISGGHAVDSVFRNFAVGLHGVSENICIIT